MIVGQLEIQLMANMARLTSDMEKAKRTVGGAVDKINNILGAIGVGISVDFLIGLTKKSNEYTKSLAALSTQISGATDQIKELDAASRKLSVQFGTDALKQSAAFYEILSAGITDTAQATALLTEANRLAIGGNADLMISVDGLTSIIKGYGDAAGTASEIADTMFTASLAGKLSIQELSEGIGKVIPLATTMGISLEEVTAGVSALTLGGISAKESITGVRAILATVAKPSAEAARLAKDIGLEFNTAGVQAMGFAGFLEDVKTKTQGSADRMAILFGGVESLIPALALTGNAGVEFNNIMTQMANKAGATENAFNKMAASPGFQWDKFMATMSNIAVTLGDALANVLTPAAELASKALNKLFGFSDVTGIEKQVQLIRQLTDKVESMSNRRNVPLIGGLLFDKKEFDLLEHQLEMAKVDLSSMEKAQQAATAVQNNSTAEIAKNTIELAKNNETKEKAAQLSTRLEKAFNLELYKLKQYEQDAKRARDITDSVATKQEKYNRALDELEHLKPYLEIETYNRKLQALESELNDVGATQRNVVNEMDQLWIQAGRNIQSIFANGIFDAFDGGLKGMISSARTAVLRILSEFAALKVSQSIGLAGIFSASGAASASAGGGSSGGGFNLMNAASLGSSALSLFKGGFGATSLLSSVGGMLPGSAGAFFGGMGGGTIAGVSSPASLMGASIGSFLGPVAALGGIDMIGRMLAGDKKLGGAEMIPVIGGFLAAMFGRGPYKFRQQSLQGDISASGFDGDITNVWRSAGGLFTKNKHKPITEQLSPESQALFDSTIGGFFQAAHDASKNLGLDVALVDNFTKQIQIKSEKGQKLTEQAITDMLTGIGDDIAKSVLPIVDQFKKVGETSAQTLSRLSNEFTSLTSAASLILGKSSTDARAFVAAGTYQGYSDFVDTAGGIDALNQKVSFFAQNFLTAAEQIAPAGERVNDELTKLGISTGITKDQFRDLVQSYGKVNGVTEETLQALLNLAPAFAQVRDAAKAAQQEMLSGAMSDLQKSVDAEKAAATDKYNASLKSVNDRIDEVTNSIGRLKSLSDALKSATESLRPMGVSQARAQIQDAIVNAKNGIFPEADSLRQVLSALTSQGTDRFSSRFEFLLSRAQSANMIGQLGALTGSKLTEQERMVSALESSREALTNGFNVQIAQLDGLISSAQQQIAVLNGMDIKLLNIYEALGSLNNLLRNMGSADTVSAGGITGNPAISNQEIVDYFKAPRTPEQIAGDAAKYGVSSSQIMAATGFTQAEVDKFFTDNPQIPRFATGTSYVPRTGPAIVHQGERIINPQQNGDIVESLKNVAKKTEENTVAIGNLYRLMRNAMQETGSGFALTTAAAV